MTDDYISYSFVIVIYAFGATLNEVMKTNPVHKNHLLPVFVYAICFEAKKLQNKKYDLIIMN